MGGGEDFENAIVFRGKPLTSGLFATFFILCTALFAYALIFFNDLSKYKYAIFVMGLLLFLLFDAYIVRNLYRRRCVMVAIGERGIFDWRISDAWIPWEVVTHVEKGMSLYFNILDAFCVQVQPAFAATFPEKILSRLMRIGVVGYRVVLWGAEGSKDRFFAALDLYYPHWREISIEVIG